MTSLPTSRNEADKPILCEIRIKGQLSRGWTEWFAGLDITPEEGGCTLLTGPVADQAALFGLLSRVRDLGLELISVNRSPAEPPEAGQVMNQKEE